MPPQRARVAQFERHLGAVLGVLGVLLSLAGCDDGRITGPTEAAPRLIVSNPVPGVGSALSADAMSRARTAATPAPAAAFISVAPGAIPYGDVVVIRNRHTGGSATALMVGGGFDPVAVAAAPGDSLRLEVRVLDREYPRVFDVAVPASSRPTVVRTYPSDGQRNVSLDANVVVVFSEPIDPQTLTPASLQLRRGTTPVDGHLDFSDSAHVSVSFVPARPLVAGAAYELIVTSDIRDLDGDPLESTVRVGFTTAEGEDISDSRILVDASRDGGVWWFPQGPDSFDPEAPHQGQALADHLRSLGYQVDELPRRAVITGDLLEQYAIVIRAGSYGSYAPGEVSAYLDFVRRGGGLLLLADHMRFAPPDELARGFGIEFAGITRGDNVLSDLVEHPVTSGVEPLGYGVGSGVIAHPASARILGRLGEGSYLDLNDNSVRDGAEPVAPAVLGVMMIREGRVLFCGDTNLWEWLPQPLLANALEWLRGS